MANTTTIVDKFMQVKGLDADWGLRSDLGKEEDDSGIKVKSITFHPSAANDVMVIKQGTPGYATTAALITAKTASAPEIFYKLASTATGQRVEFGDKGQWMRPFIDISDCTLGTAANARVDFELV